ncbi:hypothetical protein EDB84DRAFT_135903 [Lactarius hengduanensis]|nr:hypothetical protein EDB84DRAFT_135903 [Lactarius hengduanensis]
MSHRGSRTSLSSCRLRHLPALGIVLAENLGQSTATQITTAYAYYYQVKYKPGCDWLQEHEQIRTHRTECDNIPADRVVCSFR